jgi:hypothetical protein
MTKALYILYNIVQMMDRLEFSATIRLRNNGKEPASRHFVTLPQDIAEHVRLAQEHVPRKRGRGAVKVEAHIGFVKWKTSIFPSKEHGTYVLPLKKEVRKELRIGEGDKVSILLTLL